MQLSPDLSFVVVVTSVSELSVGVSTYVRFVYPKMMFNLIGLELVGGRRCHQGVKFLAFVVAATECST